MGQGRKTAQVQENGGEWVTLGDAARALKTSRYGVLARIAKGDLESREIAGRTLVVRASLEKLLKVA